RVVVTPLSIDRDEKRLIPLGLTRRLGERVIVDLVDDDLIAKRHFVRGAGGRLVREEERAASVGETRHGSIGELRAVENRVARRRVEEDPHVAREGESELRGAEAPKRAWREVDGADDVLGERAVAIVADDEAFEFDRRRSEVHELDEAASPRAERDLVQDDGHRFARGALREEPALSAPGGRRVARDLDRGEAAIPNRELIDDADERLPPAAHVADVRARHPARLDGAARELDRVDLDSVDGDRLAAGRRVVARGDIVRLAVGEIRERRPTLSAIERHIELAIDAADPQPEREHGSGVATEIRLALTVRVAVGLESENDAPRPILLAKDHGALVGGAVPFETDHRLNRYAARKREVIRSDI